MKKMIVICGQTSTGKSDLAVAIALELKMKNINAEIISADSRQVYKGLDLGSGKITQNEMRDIPHHLLDVAIAKKVFTVANYKKLADKTIKQILKRGNIPIICGGSGFYIDAIINDSVFPQVPPNIKLRKELENKTAPELFNILKKLDKNRSKTIDPNNPVRLIRAIEIATTLGSVPPHRQDLSNYNILKIGFTLPDELLKARIYKRILKRIKLGMIKEVEDLHTNGLPWSRMDDLGLEYRYISQYLQAHMTKKEMIDKLNDETWQYAKRQKTWFKRDKDIIWLDMSNPKQTEAVTKKLVLDFLS